MLIAGDELKEAMERYVIACSLCFIVYLLSGCGFVLAATTAACLSRWLSLAILPFAGSIAHNVRRQGEVGRDGPAGPPDGVPATEPPTEPRLSGAT